MIPGHSLTLLATCSYKKSLHKHRTFFPNGFEQIILFSPYWLLLVLRFWSNFSEIRARMSFFLFLSTVEIQFFFQLICFSLISTEVRHSKRLIVLKCSVFSRFDVWEIDSCLQIHSCPSILFKLQLEILIAYLLLHSHKSDLWVVSEGVEGSILRMRLQLHCFCLNNKGKRNLFPKLQNVCVECLFLRKFLISVRTFSRD